ncbi:MAG TPA: cupin domain-containing protein [Candidatus Methanofastidiosa archaeon]|nr:cupin domain-containing protein [Candidatus Methanofastidiosa archaeon]
MTTADDLNESVIFPKGYKVEGALKDYFIGDAWIAMLVADEEYNCPVYNVTFEPRARNNWHKHPGGQILLVTGGKGYYQEEGKPAQLLEAGDVVKIPSNVKHWHGAGKDSWFVHIGISTNPHAGDAVWLEEVSDEEYDKLEE